MPRRTRRIAICEDSPPFAEALTKLFERDDELEVVGRFPTGEDLIAGLAGLGADVVTMDLEVPGMGGLRAIETIMRDQPLPILVISSHSGEQSLAASEALAAGALEAVHKRTMRIGHPDEIWAKALRSRIKLLANLKLARRLPSGSASAVSSTRPHLDHPVRAIAVGASAGGPPALLSVLEALPGDFPIPVMVVQHIASGFLGGLVNWLQQQIPLRVGIAAEGDRAGPGVWFAPEHAHLELGPAMHFSLDEVRGLNAHCPAVDVLFSSVAETLRESVLGVVLSGMGRDGAEGVKAIRAAGGCVIAQDEGSAAVHGMPRAAAEVGAYPVLPLGEIGPVLKALRIEAVHA